VSPVGSKFVFKRAVVVAILWSRYVRVFSPWIDKCGVFGVVDKSRIVVLSLFSCVTLVVRSHRL